MQSGAASSSRSASCFDTADDREGYRFRRAGARLHGQAGVAVARAITRSAFFAFASFHVPRQCVHPPDRGNLQRRWKNDVGIEGALQASEERFKALVAASSEALYSMSPDWSEMRQLAGGSFLADTTTANSAWLADYIDPADHERVQAAIKEAIAFKSTFHLEHRVRRADGSLGWTLSRAVPLLDEQGEIKEWFGAATDVTERREAEEALRELTASLEERVDERTRALVDAQEQLRQSQKLEAIGQLTGGVAHDFNNLLTVIRGSVDILRREGLTEDKRVRYMEAIGASADRAAALTSQLLAFARRQALKPETFDVVISLREVAEMIHTLAGPRIEMDMQLPDEPCFVLADRSQFDTTLINLGVNARDAMDGEGRLTIAARAVSGIPPIRGHQAVAGNFIAVTIGDSGTGIEAEIASRIFEPFFTTKEVGKGTGLGLSQVYGFAKQSGGDIQMDSIEGAGTTFTLYLPRAAAQEGATPADDLSETPVDGDGLCVLLVEDNPEVGAFASDALEELGYESVHVVDAERALQELERDSSRFDAVFTDVVMPGMGGVELGREIRRRRLDVPVILTSGYSNVLAEDSAHGFDLLHKPYSVEQLSRVLHRAIRSIPGKGSVRAA
jgi:signal transduction histidine kinase/CheY-like chemotaxis protein